MYKQVILSIIVFIGLTLSKIVNADISGKVSDQTGKPIVGATLKLVKNGATTTSGVDGRYTLSTTKVKNQLKKYSEKRDITFENGFLKFTLIEAAPVKYEVFDVKGNLLKKEELKNTTEGNYRFNILEDIHSTTLLVVKASIGMDEKNFYYLPLSNKNGVFLPNLAPVLLNNRVGKLAAVIDTLKVTANGYKAQAIPVSSYDVELNVTMESEGTGGDCGEIKLISCKMSTAISTVAIVEWSYSKSVSSAYIEFGLEGSNEKMKAPVDLKEQNYRTLLLGMKQQKKYVFRIVVESGSGTCMSKDTTITTGTIASAPKITKSGSGSSSIKKGFIVTTTGNGWAMGGGMGGGGTPMAVIFDLDGDVVWAVSAPKGTSRARMSWDGKYMWINNANVGNANPYTAGEMRRVSMDGMKVDSKIEGLSCAHHDFTVTPKNEMVTIAYNSSGSSSQILSYSADGKITTIIPDVTKLYQPVGDCHPNYIQYDSTDDSFIISDRNPNLFVKFLRNGTLLWQFGGSNPKGKSFSVSETWQVNHGFEMEKDGRFVFFNNGAGSMMGGGGSSRVKEFKLDESTMTATKLWETNTNGSSMSLGNVQRMPDGHYLVTVSNAGKMEVLDSSHNVVWTFSTSEFGYSEYRESLYGPPVDY